MKELKRRIARMQLMFAKAIHRNNYMKAYNKYLLACGVDICGKVKYIASSAYIDTGYGRNIHIGDNVVISVNSIILAHDYSIECGMASVGLGDINNEKKIVKDVFIGRNVFVGAGCIILPGTHIGNDCIIGAGTVCYGTIPDNSVVVGGKYRVIKKTTDWTKEKMEAAMENGLAAASIAEHFS